MRRRENDRCWGAIYNREGGANKRRNPCVSEKWDDFAFALCATGYVERSTYHQYVRTGSSHRG